jgi:transposase
LAPATGAPAGTGVVVVTTAGGVVALFVVTGGNTGIAGDVAVGLGIAVIGGLFAIGGTVISATGALPAAVGAVGLAGVVCATAAPMEAEARTARVQPIFEYTPTPRKSEKPLANRRRGDSALLMILAGFLDAESRRDLIELARDGSAAHRLARRANALVLLDDGMSCASIAKVLFLDDDTIRTWYQLYQEDGIEGLASFHHEGSCCRLTAEQQDKLTAWITATLPRTTRQVGAWIEAEFAIDYQTRSGLIALLHRLGMEHRKPKTISRKLDPVKQAGFIKEYEARMNQLAADEAVIFVDAAHPTHTVRPVGCWAPKDVPVAVEQSSGRDRLNIHGAINLETGQTIMKDVLTVDALSTIMLLMAIEAMYPGMRHIHVYLDNARYHHAKLVTAWLARPDCRIKLHFVPAYCPHLNPIERLWGLMHRHITHNKCYANFRDFSAAMLGFLRHEVPAHWNIYCDEVTDNFRVIDPTNFRIIA